MQSTFAALVRVLCHDHVLDGHLPWCKPQVFRRVQYNKHGTDGRDAFQGSSNTPVSEQINKLMERFDKTAGASTIPHALLVYGYYIHCHNTQLREDLTTSRFRVVCLDAV